MKKKGLLSSKEATEQSISSGKKIPLKKHTSIAPDNGTKEIAIAKGEKKSNSDKKRTRSYSIRDSVFHKWNMYSNDYKGKKLKEGESVTGINPSHLLENLMLNLLKEKGYIKENE